jgi:hypothetical protein
VEANWKFFSCQICIAFPRNPLDLHWNWFPRVDRRFYIVLHPYLKKFLHPSTRAILLPLTVARWPTFRPNINQNRPPKVFLGWKKLDAVKGQNIAKSGRKQAGIFWSFLANHKNLVLFSCLEVECMKVAAKVLFLQGEFPDYFGQRPLKKKSGNSAASLSVY